MLSVAAALETQTLTDTESQQEEEGGLLNNDRLSALPLAERRKCVKRALQALSACEEKGGRCVYVCVSECVCMYVFESLCVSIRENEKKGGTRIITY